MYTARPDIPILGYRSSINNKQTNKKVMKTIAILALTAAALVSCQQQQQQQVVTPTPEPAPVAPIKK